MMKEEKKIYVVTDGEYSDYHICGVFSSRYKAKKATAKLGGYIDVWPVDALDKIIGMNIFAIIMTREGDILTCEKRNMDWYNVDRYLSHNSHVSEECWVLARDEKHAIRKAKEWAIVEGKKQDTIKKEEKNEKNKMGQI